MGTERKAIYIVKRGGAVYGYSRSIEKASAAIARGALRGVIGVIDVYTSAPKGMTANVFLTPFDDRKAGF